MEAYITSILLSYVDKYVRDFKRTNAQVSLWDGGVVLHNLVLKADVLQRELKLPLNLVSGRIHELLIQVPWTKIMSEPIVVTIDTIECVLGFNTPGLQQETTEEQPQQGPSVEAPPGYMRALIRRIVNNISVKVQHLIVKYVQDDLVLSLNVKHLLVESASADWEPAFADIDPILPIIRRLVKLDDLTFCLDQSDSDGKIRYYQEPLLYRCHVEIRVLMRLLSANIRRASHIDLQLYGAKIACGITTDQVLLLNRLVTEQILLQELLHNPSKNEQSSKQGDSETKPMSPPNSSEQHRESWSEWAWSWLPSATGIVGPEVTPTSTGCMPIYFSAYCQELNLALKIMETEPGGRKRPRAVFEIMTEHLTLKAFILKPTQLRVRIGLRSIEVYSRGKCICGHYDSYAAINEPTVYLKHEENAAVSASTSTSAVETSMEEWNWPREEFEKTYLETLEIPVDEFTDPKLVTKKSNESSLDCNLVLMAKGSLWELLDPVLYIEFCHEKAPPCILTNPYINQPKNFEYSDWIEEFRLTIHQNKHLSLRVCTGLLHRIEALTSFLKEFEVEPSVQTHVLTVEECEALTENLPQKRINILFEFLIVRLFPWDHSLTEKPEKLPLVVQVELKEATIVLLSPLYSHRVCQAVAQMPEIPEVLDAGSKLTITLMFPSMEVKLYSLSKEITKPYIRNDCKIVMNILLHRDLFKNPEKVTHGITIKIKEANISGSAARTLAFCYILSSLVCEKAVTELKLTSVVRDVLNDEKAVVVDVACEDAFGKIYITDNTFTYIFKLHAIKVTAMQDSHKGVVRQAWILSAPDIPSTLPYIRAALQWCRVQTPESIDFLGVWTEPKALCFDPLLVLWLAYVPRIRSYESQPNVPLVLAVSSTVFLSRRRTTVTTASSSGRPGSRSGSGVELIHNVTRSTESGSSEPKTNPSKDTKKKEFLTPEDLLKLHDRLQHVLMTVEIGLIMIYFTVTTATAINCDTLRGAMEQHAAALNSVLLLSAGRWSIHSNVATKPLWDVVKYDRPTFLRVEKTAAVPSTSAQEQTPAPPAQIEKPPSFPWKFKMADVAVYILEPRAAAGYSGSLSNKGLRSQIKSTVISSKTVLECVTTTVTMSLITKTIRYRRHEKKSSARAKEEAKQNADDKKAKYFSTGPNFKPTSLKEFLRGPERFNRNEIVEEIPTKPNNNTKTVEGDKTTYVTGPVTSVGINVYAETNPIMIKLDEDQIDVIATLIHFLKHVFTAVEQSPFITSVIEQRPTRAFNEPESESEEASNTSDLIPIYQTKRILEEEPELTKFIFLQWVANKLTIVVTLEESRVVLQIEDAMFSVELQDIYNQAKAKMASAFLKSYIKTEEEEYKPGALGGRVLEIQSADTDKVDNRFISVTVTQARISHLPPSWKEELHPKLLKMEKTEFDSMWEIYAILAPLEILLETKIIDNLIYIVQELIPVTSCSTQKDVTRSLDWDWPYLYLISGGVRAIMHREHEKKDDALVLSVAKINITPHPENSLCRRPVISVAESSQDGHQYEMTVNSLTLKSTHFQDLVKFETKKIEENTAAGPANPAAKWNNQFDPPETTFIVRPMDISCVFAPPFYVGSMLSSGPAFEFNLVSDCIIELTVDQIILFMTIYNPAPPDVKSIKSSDMLESAYSIGNMFKGRRCYFEMFLEEMYEFTSLDEHSESEDVTNNSKENKDTPDSTNPQHLAQSEDSGIDLLPVPKELKPISDSIRKVKSVSIMSLENKSTPTPKEYFEIFVTMGIIDITISTNNDETPLLTTLKPPPAHENDSSSDTHIPVPKKIDTSIKLFYVVLHQPNLYFWSKRSQKTLQISLFNLLLGLGSSRTAEWHEELLSTATGQPDRDTDIRPALATFKLTVLEGGSKQIVSGSQGSFNLDVERPILFHVSTDKIRRIKVLKEFLELQFKIPKVNTNVGTDSIPVMLALRRTLGKYSIEHGTIRTTQIGVVGKEGLVGWEEASLQVAVDTRPDRILLRSLITAAIVSVGRPDEERRIVMLPMHIGIEIDTYWDTSYKDKFPVSDTFVYLELDNLIFDICPDDLSIITRLEKAISSMEDLRRKSSRIGTSTKNINTLNVPEFYARYSFISGVPLTETFRPTSFKWNDPECENFYKDDLRSGAFKIVEGVRMPKPYQIVLHGNAVTWCYPHRRALLKLVVYPLPGVNQEFECVLELFNRMQSCWEAHTYFTIPVNEPKEINIYVPPPESAFARLWRYRLAETITKNLFPHSFDCEKFAPREKPFETISLPEDVKTFHSPVTAQQLSGVLRVDSYSAPHIMQRKRLNLLLNRFEIHADNTVLPISDNLTQVEGYYATKPLMRHHRVINIMAHETSLYLGFGSPSGALLLLKTKFSADCINCSNQVMEEFIDKFDVQGGVSFLPKPREARCFRFHASPIRLSLNTQRVRTLKSLALEWKDSIEKAIMNYTLGRVSPEIEKSRELDSLEAFEGRVGYWIHNTSSEALRVGQVGTDEDLPIASGVRFAYNWRNPDAQKKVRFALNRPSSGMRWSDGIAFDETRRLRLTTQIEEGDDPKVTNEVELHISNKKVGVMHYMTLAGRLVFANMLRFKLIYKLRTQESKYLKSTQAILTGELPTESVVPSFLCEVFADVSLKIKLANHNASWSGDIPLRECPKENVPWLVKVPTEGEMDYISVWCRVTISQSTGRILVTFWPLYMLLSHLPQDTDVLVVSEKPEGSVGKGHEVKNAPLLQSAPGRDTLTHLLAHGTTTAKHSLSFQYRNLDCPVTREAIKLHYGMTQESVFNKTPLVDDINEVLDIIETWLKYSNNPSKVQWPYSTVTKHWLGDWNPALLQPRCEINITYVPIRAGGGCSLQLVLSPVALLCNASPLTITLRAHDAAPLCKVEPGTAIAPPSAIIKKPFFLSLELYRETFVSRQLELYQSDPGPYTELLPGQVAVDHPIAFAIQCSQKVAFLTLYYEIVNDINVFGVSSTFFLINNMNKTVLVSAVATVDDPQKIIKVHPKKFMPLKPAENKLNSGVAMCKFVLRDRWHGSDHNELNAYICLALPINTEQTNAVATPVPVQLTKTSSRRKGIALINEKGKSVPVVVTQQKHEGRWLIMIGPDKYPQYVVKNDTHHRIAIAEPVPTGEGGEKPSVMTDCYGVLWNCVLRPNSVLHYSTPSFSARYTNEDDKDPTPMLTFSRIGGDEKFSWCQPVVVQDGEQLLQLPTGNLTVKLSINTHTYSTLIEIQPVCQTDIAASDIRHRITMATSASTISFKPALSIQKRSELMSSEESETEIKSSYSLHRVMANEQLLHEESDTDHVRFGVEQLDNKSLKSVDGKDDMSLKDEAPQDTSVQEKIKQDMGPQHNVQQEKTSLIDIEKPTTNEGSNVTLKLETLEQPRKEEPEKEKPKEEINHENQSDANISELTTQTESTSTEDLTVIQSWISDDDQSCKISDSLLVTDLVRGLIESIALEVSSFEQSKPLFAVYIDRAAILVSSRPERTFVTATVADFQMDNLHYDSGLYDFAVVGTTRSSPFVPGRCPPIRNLFLKQEAFDVKEDTARVVLLVTYDFWESAGYFYNGVTEISVRVGPLAMYLEDSFIRAIVDVYRAAVPPSKPSTDALTVSEVDDPQKIVVLRLLNIEPIKLKLTLHTAVRMYIALDQSPVSLTAYRKENLIMSRERLAHNLTVHYLSAIILGAGWVVGGLELLGAPGALAARVSSATGGVKGFASAAAAGIVRSLSVLAGSLARNLDLLAGDEEHARRAAAARRRVPNSFISGLITGLANIAINILGAVGGLAHHPLVGMAMGETESGAQALRRGFIGALTKPLSATADLVAYAGHGLLNQTGWDPEPQPRAQWVPQEELSGWRRDCVRWTFRLAELNVSYGFTALFNNAPVLLLLTQKHLVVVEANTDFILEMIDFRQCHLRPCQGNMVELEVTSPQIVPRTGSEITDDQARMTETAMARVAHYTGTHRAGGGAGGEVRVLQVLAATGETHALQAALAVSIHTNKHTHFALH